MMDVAMRENKEKGPTLLVLAAGMGSRYGGLKQLDGVGANGETILEYAVYDAIRAGFTKVVFVIRRDFERAFKEQVTARFEQMIEVDYAYQSMDDLPEGCGVDPMRSKPLGTGHAVWAARSIINEPFAVINADDFYGAKSYEMAVRYFKRSEERVEGKLNLGLVGFELMKTLSANGTVSRGICSVNDADQLVEVVEHTRIEKTASGPLSYGKEDQTASLSADVVTSMNFFLLRPPVFAAMEAQLSRFLKSGLAGMTAEFYLPEAIGKMVKEGRAEVGVLRSDEAWLGITYSEDRAGIVAALAELIGEGVYPEKLWA